MGEEAEDSDGSKQVLTGNFQNLFSVHAVQK